MDYFVLPDDHTPPATPPLNNNNSSNKAPRPAQRLRSSYIDLSLGDSPIQLTSTLSRNDLEYIGSVTSTFQQLTSEQKHFFLAELLNDCDTELLSFAQSLIVPKLKIDFLKELPIELSLHVLSFIDDPRDLANASRVSKFWNSLLKDETTWKSLCLKHRYRRRSSLFNQSSLIIQPSSTRRPSWKPCSPTDRVSYRDYFRRKYNIEKAWMHGFGQVVYCPNHIGQALVTSLQIDDQFIVIGCDNHRIEVFSAETGAYVRTLLGHSGGVWTLHFVKTGSDEHRVLVSGGCDRTVLVWNLTTGRLMHTLYGHSSTVRCLKVASDGKTAVTGSRDASVRIWDIEHGIIRRVCIGHEGSVRCLDIHGRYVATGSYDGTARLWDMETGRCLHRYVGHSQNIYSIAFDGVRIVTGSLDWTIKVWSPNHDQCVATLNGHTSLVGHLQLLTPYESSTPLLVSGGSDGCLRVWDLATYECRHRISAHDNSVSSLQADQQRILSGGSDGRVKLWDLETGTLIRSFSEPARTIWKVQFTDSRAVVVAQRSAQRNPADPLEDVTTHVELHKFDVLQRGIS